MFANRLPHRLTFVFVLVILLAATVIPAVSAQEASPAEEGIALYDAGDFDAAFEPLLRAAYASPADIEVQRRLLVTALRTGHYGWANFASNFISNFGPPDTWGEISAEMEAALEAYPYDAGAAIVAAWVGAPEPDAQERVDRVFELLPDSAIGHDLQGFQRYFSGDIEGALASFETALSVAGDEYPQIAAELAWVFAYDANQPERAIEIMTQAIEMEPELGLLYNIRGGFYDATGDAEAAMEDMNTAVALNPADYQSMNARGDFLAAQGNFEAAYTEYEAALARFALSPTASIGLPRAAIEAGLPLDPLIDARDRVDADAVLTVDAPFSGEMTFNRVVRLPVEVEPGQYTITMRAADPLALDPLLILTVGANIPLALNDDRDADAEQADGAYDAQITWTAEEGESYVVYLLHSGAGSEGEFTVTLERVEN